jgi:DnaK suppressor protein
MTRRDDLENIRKMLLRRREALSIAQRGMSTELDALKAADRDPEYEETAQVAQAEYTLSTIHDSHQREIEQVDAALERLDQGSYGLCADCELDIPFDRLMAVPYSVRCADCATAREARQSRHSPATM